MPLQPAAVRPARRRPRGRSAGAPALTSLTVLAGVLVAGALGIATAPQALAQAGDDVVRRYEAMIELDADGTAHVTLDLEVDLGTDPNRGPYLSYLVKQRFDDTRDRIYRMRDFVATSPTAPDEVQVEEDSGWLEVRIGEEDRQDVVGLHSYRLTYTVEGLVNSAEVFELADDQLYLNVIGDRWQIPLEDVTVTVTGPVGVTDTRCYTGTDGVCDLAVVQDGAAVFGHGALDVGEPFTVAVAFPAGTFGDARPILQDRWAVDRAFALTPVTGGLAGLMALAGLGAVARRVRRDGGDEQFLATTPGLVPAAGQGAATGPRSAGPTAVRFTPPEGLRPGVVGTLVDERAESRDVTATLVDLAVRGYLTVGPAPLPADAGGPAQVGDDDWYLTRTDVDPDGTRLLPFEATLLAGVFADGPDVRLSELRTSFSETLGAVRAALYQDVTARGWFRGNPRRVRRAWAARGVLVLALGVVTTAVLALLTSWALLGLAPVVVGIAMVATTGAAPARTAEGTAVQVQAEGFRHYLATAEADQLRFEDGADLFSRYLPYAIAFGLTERWTRVVAEAAAAGLPVPQPAWYAGSTATWVAGGLGRDLTRFTSATDAAVSAPSPGAGGSSGFSGGSVGGGVSGGGGGTW